jgi:hypothetical protein
MFMIRFLKFDWVSQFAKSQKGAVEPLALSRFRVPGSKSKEHSSIVKVEGTLGYHSSQLCVVQVDVSEYIYSHRKMETLCL